MRIGQLAASAGCTVETVRYYEKTGLLPVAARTSGNYRHYDQSDVERLRFIRNCRALDMTQGEIRAFLALMATPADSCGTVNALLDAHIEQIGARISELARLRQQLAALRARCQQERRLDECAILSELAKMNIPHRRSHAARAD